MRRGLILAVLALAAGCTAPAAGPCPAGTAAAREITAFFGRHVTNAGGEARRITDAEWAAFRADELTPRFPDGTTELAGRGTWRHREGGRTVEEDSTILLLVVPEAEAAPALARLNAAAEAYRRRHQQDSVGVSLRPACAAGLL